MSELEKVDINLAGEETLMALPGIGETLAKRIIQYRTTVHPFEEVIELTAVPGISERMVRNLEARVTVGNEEVDEGLEGEEVASADVEPELADAEVQEEAQATDTPHGASPGPGSAAPVDEPLVLEDEGQMANHVDADESSLEDSAISPAPPAEQEVKPDLPAEEAGIAGGQLADAPPPPETGGVARESRARTESAPVADGAGMPAAMATELDRRARRRGCIVLLLGGLLGAVAGTIVTLTILATLNRGTLSFSSEDQRLRNDIERIGTDQGALQGDLEAMNAQWQLLATRTGEVGERQEELNDSFAALERNVQGYGQDIQALETKTAEIGERLDSVAAAAENFDSFLDRMRDLLFELQGPPATPESTAEPSGAATTSTATPEMGATLTPTSSPTRSGQPTRTPRPTATPFTLPTSTPAPQP